MGIADFLISRRQQRLLAPLLTQPHRSFSSSELLRLSGAGRGAGQLQLQKLLSAGVVLDERVGNQRRIRVPFTDSADYWRSGARRGFSACSRAAEGE